MLSKGPIKFYPVIFQNNLSKVLKYVGAKVVESPWKIFLGFFYYGYLKCQTLTFIEICKCLPDIHPILGIIWKGQIQLLHLQMQKPSDVKWPIRDDHKRGRGSQPVSVQPLHESIMHFFKLVSLIHHTLLDAGQISTEFWQVWIDDWSTEWVEYVFDWRWIGGGVDQNGREFDDFVLVIWWITLFTCGLKKILR